jgi:signal transduction histidine kinase
MFQESAVDVDHVGQLESIRSEVELAADELRTLARGIYPAALSERGVAGAIRLVAISAPIPVAVIDNGIGRYSAAVEAAVYFSVREAVQNAIKHAGPDARVAVVLERGSRGGVRFEVTDDGVGMSMPTRTDGIGLISIRDRLGAVSGELEITSAPGRGTTVRGAIPEDQRCDRQTTSHRRADRRTLTPRRNLADRDALERSA